MGKGGDWATKKKKKGGGYNGESQVAAGYSRDDTVDERGEGTGRDDRESLEENEEVGEKRARRGRCRKQLSSYGACLSFGSHSWDEGKHLYSSTGQISDTQGHRGLLNITWVCPSMITPTYTHTCTYVLLCISIDEHVSPCIHTHTHTHTPIYMLLWISIDENASLCIHTHIHTHTNRAEVGGLSQWGLWI